MLVNMSTSGKLTSLLVMLVVAIGFLLVVGGCDALRMINLDVPETARFGDTIELSCFFSLEGPVNSKVDHTTTYSQGGAKSATEDDAKFKSTTGERLAPPANNNDNGKQTGLPANISEQLYAIKWYKDGREFYRYLAKDWRPKQALPADGLSVDVDKSDNHTVVLKSVSLRTSGLFRCEVSTELPFVTKSIERRMLIYSLPNEGPRIESVSQTKIPGALRLFQGEHIGLLCSASDSKPAAALDWIINDSLNLSSPEWSHLRPLFQIKSQRFVRVRSKGSAATTLKTPSARTTFYEVRNQTLFPVDSNSSSISPVNPPAGSLDQFVETSTSRLNLSYQLLSQRIRSSHETTGNKQSIHNSALKLGNHQLNVGPKKHMVLKVRCEARVLHWIMSDEVKVHLANRTRETGSAGAVQVETAQKEPRFGRPLGRSGAKSLAIVNNIFLLTLSFIATIKQLSF